MSNLLAKRYKNNKAKAVLDAQKGKKLSNAQKVQKNNNQITKVKTENIQVAKEPKVLNLD